jgi:hypothetical protein
MIALTGIGADPEVFLRTKNGAIQAAVGLIGGTKTQPRQVKELGIGFAVQEDNVAAEFNIPPTLDPGEFSANIEKTLKYLNKLVRPKGLRIVFEAAAHFPEDQLLSKQALELGCEPDSSVWTLTFNPRPEAPKTLRTAAGHVHFGWEKPNNDQRLLVGRACDLFLGVPSILVTEPNERRSLYGKAGAVRSKPYGLEYRTLDNFWLATTHYQKRVHENCLTCIGALNLNPDQWNENLEDFKEDIQHAINSHDKATAQVLVKRFGVPTFQ